MNCDTPLEHSHTSRGDSNLWQLEQYCCIEGLRSGNVCTKYCVNALADFGTADPGGTSTDISCRSSSNAFLVKLCLIEYWKSSRWVMKTVIIAPGYKGVLWGWLHCSSAACKSGSLFSSSDDSKMLSSSPLLSQIRTSAVIVTTLTYAVIITRIYTPETTLVTAISFWKKGNGNKGVIQSIKLLY